MLTVKEARELFLYDPETGVLRWKHRPSYNIPIGSIAGTRSTNKHRTYIQVQVKKRFYKAHRIIVTIMSGKIPELPVEVDHINGKTDDNRWANLRCVTRQENSKNSRKSERNKSGTTGVYWNKRKKRWHSRISDANQKIIHLGYFRSLKEATKSRQDAEKMHGYHTNHGRPQ